MFKTLSNNYFCVQRPNGYVDVYTFGDRCEVVKCVTCLTASEAIAWVNRKENRRV